MSKVPSLLSELRAINGQSIVQGFHDRASLKALAMTSMDSRSAVVTDPTAFKADRRYDFTRIFRGVSVITTKLRAVYADHDIFNDDTLAQLKAIFVHSTKTAIFCASSTGEAADNNHRENFERSYQALPPSPEWPQAAFGPNIEKLAAHRLHRATPGLIPIESTDTNGPMIHAAIKDIIISHNQVRGSVERILDGYNLIRAIFAWLLMSAEKFEASEYDHLVTLAWRTLADLNESMLSAHEKNITPYDLSHQLMAQYKNLIPDIDILIPPAKFNASLNIKIMLRSLIENALDHAFYDMDEADRRLSIKGSINTDGNYEIVCTDNGAGISEHDKPCVFGLRKSSLPGNPGVALCLIKQALQENNSDINFTSVVGTGTTFTITIDPSSFALL